MRKTLGIDHQQLIGVAKEYLKISLWLILEFYIYFVLLIVLDIVIWWSVVGIGKTFFECILLDGGFLKPPRVECSSIHMLGSYFNVFAQNVSFVSTITFFYFLHIILITIKGILPAQLLAIFFISSSLVFRKSKRYPKYQFPLFTKILTERIKLPITTKNVIFSSLLLATVVYLLIAAITLTYVKTFLGW